MLISISSESEYESSYIYTMVQTHATTSKIMMIRPRQFRFNEQTAGDNVFQHKTDDGTAHAAAEEEFDKLVQTLKRSGVEVNVMNESLTYDTPDAVFPNNWLSTHQNGTIVIYPMFAENRRKEVRHDIVKQLSKKYGYNEVIDWTTYAQNNQFLEGTGSFVLDRINKVAYACISERTDLELAERWGEVMNFDIVPFTAVDRNDKLIYHTNVMMNIGEGFAVVCLESIRETEDREKVVKSLEYYGKEVIPITYEQMNHFAGNMLSLSNNNQKQLLVMSEAAYQSLWDEQITRLESFTTILHVPIPAIEKNGGGSVRCMIAELF